MVDHVCLTFDFDAVSLWIQRKMTTRTQLSRGEFGVYAVPRILHMLSERNIKSTWFVPGHTIETFPDICNAIVKEGHEIALHGYCHENINELTSEEEWEMHQKSFLTLKSFLGYPPKGFRSPAWDLSSKSIDFLEQLGILYDSSLMSRDYTVYYARKEDDIYSDRPMIFGKDSSVVEIPVSWSLDDYPHFEYLKTPTTLIPGLQSTELVFKNWKNDIIYMQRDFHNGVTVATFHPQVIGRGHRLLGLEKWIDNLIELGVRFSKMDQIAQSFKEGQTYGAYQPLKNKR